LFEKRVNTKVLGTLEFTRVLQKLAGLTSFSAGRDLALAVVPASDLPAVRRMQEETAQMELLQNERPEFGIRSAHDVRDQARHAALGGLLDPALLLAVLDTVRSGQYVSGAIAKLDDRFHRLQDLAVGIQPLRTVTAEIEQCLNDQGDVLDRASPTLAGVRAEQKVAHNRLIDRVNSYLTSHRAMLQDAIVTTRGDRYVIPVKAEFKNQVKGIVHDQSGSGATFFIEPLEIMELNNTWRSLQVAEQQEIERILRALSDLVGQHAGAIVTTVQSLAMIDLVMARVRLAGEQHATQPVLNERGDVRLDKARHPLLTGTVVPISVHMTRDAFMMVITGPNTGGKTVALKTIGLLTLMAQAGMQIPASAGSEISIYREVWADVGDEQSIEQSLSTFSSHMTNIVRILREVRERDLVLLDELGAGTDPAEGSALARSILDYLRARRISTVATTHYSELKAYAHTQQGVLNASVEFDLQTLSPTYRLIVGLPGKSNALAIARRLGLPDEIVTGATNLLSPDQVQVENLLESIAGEERQAEAARKKAERHEREVWALKRRLDDELAALERRKDAVVEEAFRQADVEIQATRRQLQQLMDELQRSGGNRQQAREADFDAAALQRHLAERKSRTWQRRSTAEGPTTDVEQPLAVGDWVRVRSLNQIARLLSLNTERGEAEVQFGQMKAKVKLSDVTSASRAEAADSGADDALPRAQHFPTPMVSIEMDIRGQRPDDVASAVERYIDDASQAGLPFVRLIHGKGTGALRSAIREQLARHPLVQQFQSADTRQGGDGVTVVSFREG